MRVVSLMFRFIYNLKLKTPDRDKSPIGFKCIQRAANHCMKSAHLKIYFKEIKALKTKIQLKLISMLINLSPFLDHEGIL